MTPRFSQIKQYVRSARYMELTDLIGVNCHFADVDAVEGSVVNLLQQKFGWQSMTFATERKSLVGQVEKYNLLDVDITLPEQSQFYNIPIAGMSQLRSLRALVTLPDEDKDDDFALEMAATSLEISLENTIENRTYVKLFLRGQTDIRNLPNATHFPQTFTIVDACMTNDGGIWLNKHFYL